MASCPNFQNFFNFFSRRKSPSRETNIPPNLSFLLSPELLGIKPFLFFPCKSRGNSPRTACPFELRARCWRFCRHTASVAASLPSLMRPRVRVVARAGDKGKCNYNRQSGANEVTDSPKARVTALRLSSCDRSDAGLALLPLICCENSLDSVLFRSHVISDYRASRAKLRLTPTSSLL